MKPEWLYKLKIKDFQLGDLPTRKVSRFWKEYGYKMKIMLIIGAVIAIIVLVVVIFSTVANGMMDPTKEDNKSDIDN